MARRKEGEPTDTATLVQQVSSGAVKALSKEVEPVADEIKRQAALGAKAATALIVAGTAGFLAVQFALFAAVVGLGRRIGGGKAAAIVAGGMVAVSAAALRVGLKDLPTSPGRLVLERLARVLRSQAPA